MQTFNAHHLLPWRYLALIPAIAFLCGEPIAKGPKAQRKPLPQLSHTCSSYSLARSLYLKAYGVQRDFAEDSKAFIIMAHRTLERCDEESDVVELRHRLFQLERNLTLDGSVTSSIDN